MTFVNIKKRDALASLFCVLAENSHVKSSYKATVHLDYGNWARYKTTVAFYPKGEISK